jgi:hypothetical protein
VDDALITQDKITQEEYKIKLDAQKQKNNEISKPEESIRYNLILYRSGRRQIEITM